MLHISLAAEKIGFIYGFPITNSLLATWIVMGLLFIFTWAATRNLRLVPSGIQLTAELVIGGLYDFFESVSGKHIKEFFSLVATFFIMILLSNWFGLLPGVGTIGFHHGEEFVPLLRSANADLNTTGALAIISVIAMQYYGLKNVGVHYLQRFFTFKDPILFSVGILELISDISKVLSFAFRLFGNIFAGEVLLAVMAFLIPFIAPIPFLALEVFVGVIQAVVFSMLSAAFFTIAATHGAEAKEVSAHG